MKYGSGFFIPTKNGDASPTQSGCFLPTLWGYFLPTRTKTGFIVCKFRTESRSMTEKQPQRNGEIATP